MVNLTNHATENRSILTLYNLRDFVKTMACSVRF